MFADGRSPCVGAVQEQMLDTSGFEFGFVFPQFSYDCGLIRTTALYIYIVIVSHIQAAKESRDFGGFAVEDDRS